MPDPTSHAQDMKTKQKSYERDYILAKHENHMLIEYQEGELPKNWWLNPWSTIKQLQLSLDKSVACWNRLYTNHQVALCDIEYLYLGLPKNPNAPKAAFEDYSGRVKEINIHMMGLAEQVKHLTNVVSSKEAIITRNRDDHFFIKRELANKDYLNGSEINELNLRDAFDILICTDEVRKKKNEELLSRIAELEAECKRLREASFVTNVSSDDYKKLEDKYGLLKSYFPTDVIDENSVYVAPFDFCYDDEPIKKPSRKKPKAKAKRKSKPKTKNKRK